MTRGGERGRGEGEGKGGVGVVSAHANLSTFLNLANFYQKCYINVIQKLIDMSIFHGGCTGGGGGGGREEVTPPPSTFAMENG